VQDFILLFNFCYVYILRIYFLCQENFTWAFLKTHMSIALIKVDLIYNFSYVCSIRWWCRKTPWVCVLGGRISPYKSPQSSCGMLDPPMHLEGNPCLTQLLWTRNPKGQVYINLDVHPNLGPTTVGTFGQIPPRRRRYSSRYVKTRQKVQSDHPHSHCSFFPAE
jgi:hypothetical protein